MLRKRVDLTEMHAQLRAIAGERAGTHSRIRDGRSDHGRGRSSLLRVAIDNLLRNSWKDPSSRSSARIEFGVQTFKDGVPVYFVRDDAMTESDLIRVPPIGLFQRFQRLHPSEEFPGNGIRLLTVPRIGRRHSGDAWAEGEVGKGATFYFSWNKKGHLLRPTSRGWNQSLRMRSSH